MKKAFYGQISLRNATYHISLIPKLLIVRCSGNLVITFLVGKETLLCENCPGFKIHSDPRKCYNSSREVVGSSVLEYNLSLINSLCKFAY